MIDHKGMADAIVSKFKKRESYEEEPGNSDEGEESTEEKRNESTADHGSLLLKAIKAGNSRAVKECIRSIMAETGDESGEQPYSTDNGSDDIG